MRSRLRKAVALIGNTRARHLLVTCGLLMGIFLAAATFGMLLDQRHRTIELAGRELQNLALILAEETDRSLQAVELVQTGLVARLRAMGIESADALRRDGGSVEIFQDLGDRILGLSQIAALSISDASGRLLNYSRSWPAPPIDGADRDYIQAMFALAGPTLFISAPRRSNSTGRWTIYLSQRFKARDGSLIGVVTATMEPTHLEQAFSRVLLSDGGSVALFRSDGVLMARHPPVDLKIGASYGASANFRRLTDALDHGIVRLESQFDGLDRLVAPHSVPHYPLVIAAAETAESALSVWRDQARAVGTGAMLLELVIGGIVVLGWRHLRSHEALDAAEADLALAIERERGARALQTQEHRFDIALNNMLQGLLMFDHTGRLLVVNRRLSEMLGVPDGALAPGMTYRDVTDRVVAAGQVTADDMQGIRERRAELIARNERAVATWELTNGRAFTMTHQPMQEGWLTTFEEISERREVEARMVHLAHHDALTDLPNRILFRQKLEGALAHARRGDAMALLCLDLDQFKAVNDTLGHPVGDALLRSVAERLTVRSRDIDSVARLGGDEFAIVQTAIKKPTDVISFADRLLELFDAPFEVAGHQIVISSSIGIALAPQDGTDADQLLKNADLALYRAKVDGRGVYRLFQAEMDAEMQARRVLEVDLRQALRSGQFELFYQPLVNLRAGAVVGLEALLRWRHPQQGLVSPAHFIPLAEEIGLIVPIGEWALGQACAAAAQWPDDIRIAVNLSPAQFKSRNLVASVASALHENGLAPDRLELEITETVMLQDTDASLGTLQELHALGVSIAMDDFGTGYSSLSYLQRFPFDRIKIDQSFVSELNGLHDCGAIVRAITGLSRELGMATTAEGVETQEQLRLLASAGCTEVQGYLFSPAVPRDAVIGLFQAISEMLRPTSEAVIADPVE